MKKLYLVSLLLILLSCKTTNNKDLSLEYYNIGNGFLELGKLEEAIEYYNKSLDVDYDNNSSRYNLSLAYVKRGEYDLAIKNIEILLLWDSKNSDLQSLKAYSLYSKGELEESLKIYKEIDNLKLIDMGVKLHISKILFQLELYEESLSYIETVLKDEEFLSDNKEIYRMAGVLSRILERYDDAIVFYNEYVQVSSDSEDVLREILELYLLREDIEKQIETIDSILVFEDIEDRGELYFRRGELYLLQNNFKKGYESLKLSKDEGFNNSEMIELLLSTPDLVEEQKIRELFD